MNTRVSLLAGGRNLPALPAKPKAEDLTGFPQSAVAAVMQFAEQAERERASRVTAEAEIARLTTETTRLAGEITAAQAAREAAVLAEARASEGRLAAEALARQAQERATTIESEARGIGTRMQEMEAAHAAERATYARTQGELDGVRAGLTSAEEALKVERTRVVSQPPAPKSQPQVIRAIVRERDLNGRAKSVDIEVKQ